MARGSLHHREKPTGAPQVLRGHPPRVCGDHQHWRCTADIPARALCGPLNGQCATSKARTEIAGASRPSPAMTS